MNRTALALLAVVFAGVPAAFAWWAFGRPAEWLMTERGLLLTEGQATGQFQVVAVFSIVGVVVGLVSGFLVHRLARPARWQALVGLAGASTAAALVCWRLGIRLGPPPPQDVTGAEVLELVPSQFAVDTIVPFLVWPLAAVLAYTLSLYLSTDGVDEEWDEADEGAADDLSVRSER